MGRKQKKYHYIYKTTNLLSGKYYIGMHSTDNLDDSYLGSGKRLRYSINKHGKDNHIIEILEYCNSREELKAREEEIVNLNEIVKIDCMNLKVGGEGGFVDEEHREKFLTIGVKNGREGTNKVLKERFGGGDDWLSKFNSYVSAEAWKNKEYRAQKLIDLDWTGKKHSEETKLKISKNNKGKGKGNDNSQFGKRWITNEKENKKIDKSDLITEGWRLGRVMK